MIRTVLVVDDSRMQRRILAASLRRWGFAILEAASGDEALEICRANPPDLVLSDWMMPGMDGVEFCRRFRRMDRESYGYFILLTSKSGKEEIAHGLDAGADDFLTKPVNSGELRARIAAGDRIVRMERELTEKNRLVRSTLDELRTLYDSLDNDLIEAKKLQQSLMPDRYRNLGAAQVSLMLRSSGHVGGDLVGMFDADGTGLGLFGIDVSGHGISSALMTARIAGYLSAAAPDQNVALHRLRTGRYVLRPPAETAAKLNRLILDEMDTEHYFTLLIADVDMDTGLVRMAQAGHPHPALQRADGTIEFLGTGGMPVGLLDEAEFQQIDCVMRPGDRLMIHSDGITECAAPDGSLLGDSGLHAMLDDLRATGGPALFDALAWRLAQFAATDTFTDDLSAILLEFKPR
ncbi:fused response regulator/phosphatase [Roseovarius sp. TE539]|nr:SpoIIE family protein phosphatase [Roseovarius sp. TE539]RBI77610.1 fused response regulator/phosphatase [Roseovarius sp. TE539]